MMLKRILYLILLSFLATAKMQAQQKWTLEESVQYALKNNLQIRAGEYEVEQFKQLKKTHTEIGKTTLMLMRGNYNSVNRDNNFTISQSFPFPTVIAQQVTLGELQMETSKIGLSITRNELIYQVSLTYLHLTYLKSLRQHLFAQDSLYREFAKAAALRYKTGESTLLEKATADTHLQEIKNQVSQNEADIHIYQAELGSLLNTTEKIEVADDLHRLSVVDSSTVDLHPVLQYAKQQVAINQQLKKIERSRWLPDIMVSYFTQTLIGFQRVGNDEVYFDRNKRFSGFQVGVAIPLWFVPQAGKARAAHFATLTSQMKADHQQSVMHSQQQQARLAFSKNKLSTDYYETTALKNADLILKQSQLGFQGGEIDYVEYLQAMKSAWAIKASYLTSLNQYNQSLVRLNYLSGKN